MFTLQDFQPRLEAISNIAKDKNLKWDDSREYKSLNDLITKVKNIEIKNVTIIYNEQRMGQNQEK